MKKTLIAVGVTFLSLLPAQSLGQSHTLEQLCRNTGPNIISGNIIGQKYYEGKCLTYARYDGKLMLRLFVPESENSNEGNLLFRTTNGTIAKEPVQYSMKDGRIHYETIGKPTKNLTPEDLDYINGAVSVIRSELRTNENANQIPKQSI